MKAAQIVLIEDNPADVLLMRLALDENKIAHELIEFENGDAAVEYYCAPSPVDREVPDVILLDLNTPRADGFDVLGKLRLRFTDVPIAVITSSRARADKLQAAEQGAVYIEKPSDLHSFIDSVGAAVKQMLVSRG